MVIHSPKGMRRFSPAILTVLLTAALTLTGCCVIDDDLSQCGREYRIDYNIRMDIHTDIALRDRLGPANDNSFDLTFYHLLTGEVAERTLLEHQPDHVSMSISLDAADYHHQATANVDKSGTVSLQQADNGRTALLQQQQADTVDSHRAAIHTGRLKMEVTANQDKDFSMTLYQANSITLAYIDTTDCRLRDLRVYMTDLADGFLIADSTYLYNSNPLIRTTREKNPEGSEALFMGITFPSKGPWRLKVYATLTDGSVTETILTVEAPLKPGELRKLRFKMNAQGAIGATTSVGASVTTDWQQGGTYHPQF